MSINIKLKDGSILNVNDGATAFDAAKAISEGLARNATAAKINNIECDLRDTLKDGDTLEILTFNDEYGRRTFRHTASHILAQAIKRLYPTAKLAIGPATADGFYYDIDINIAVNAEILEKISAEMKKIVKENLSIERFYIDRDEAIKYFEDLNEPYKVELIKDLGEDEKISFYKQGEFCDLCAGSHLISTGAVKAFKLTSATGAYFRGDSNNKMLTRIYGTAFLKAKDLEEHLEKLEEAK